MAETSTTDLKLAMQSKVCIIGAGVIGLSSAVRILDTCPGSEVIIVAEQVSPNTTSDVAGGFWEPHLLGDTPVALIRIGLLSSSEGEPSAKMNHCQVARKDAAVDLQVGAVHCMIMNGRTVAIQRIDYTAGMSFGQWSGATFEYMVNLACSPLAKHVGASVVSGYRLWHDKEENIWKDLVYGYRDLTEGEVRRFPGMRDGVFYTAAMLEPRLYLPWLMKRFVDRGGKIKRMFVNNLQELASENYDVIVNCTGVGAQKLVDDRELQPVRGQVIRVNAEWIKTAYGFKDAYGNEFYVLRGASYVVMGGTEQRGSRNKSPSKTDRTRIWERCCKFLPSLKEAKILGDWVGLRPSRTSVRLELEYMDLGGKKQAVVHNYGHGGGGVTLHWGCAESAANLVKGVINGQQRSML